MSDGNGSVPEDREQVETTPLHEVGLDNAIKQAQEQYRVVQRLTAAGGSIRATGKDLQRWLREACGHEVIGFLLATMRGEPIFVTFAQDKGALFMFQAPAPAQTRVAAARTLIENMGLPKVEISDDDGDGIIVLPELELRSIQADVERRLLAGGKAESFVTEDGYTYHIEDEEPQDVTPRVEQEAKPKRSGNGDLAATIARVRARKRNGGKRD